MNKIKNYRGDWIVAVGAPYSMVRTISMLDSIGLCADPLKGYLHEKYPDEVYYSMTFFFEHVVLKLFSDGEYLGLDGKMFTVEDIKEYCNAKD